jgi:hypothetical protein
MGGLIVITGIRMRDVLVSECAEDDGDGLGIQWDGAAIDGGIGDPADLLTLHFLVKEYDDRVEKVCPVG